MQKDDPVPFTLLRVGGGQQKTDAQTGQAEDRGQHPEPGNHLAGERVERLGAGVAEPVDQSVTHLFQGNSQSRGGRPRRKKNTAKR